MSIFDNLVSTRTFEQGNWFKPGIFDVTFKEISHFNSGQGKGPMVAARFTVNKCTPTEDTTTSDFPEGASASCVFVMQSQVGPSNLKALLVAAGKALAKKTGKDPSTVTGETLSAKDYELFCSPESPLVGLNLSVTAFTKKSKAGKPFVALSWSGA